MEESKPHYNLNLIRWANQGYPLIDLSTEYWRNQTIALINAFVDLQKENEQKSSWLESYKKSNAEFMKSLTNLKFEKERLEKENEELRGKK